jgi:hypothetical protein
MIEALQLVNHNLASEAELEFCKVAVGAVQEAGQEHASCDFKM